MGKSKKRQGAKSEMSPAKSSSPPRPAEAETEECRDRDEPVVRDELVWDRSERGISDARMTEYLEAVKHIPAQTARDVLRDFNYDFGKAVEILQRSEVISDLSPLEEDILLAAAPIYHAEVDSVQAIAREKHILSLVPHASPDAVRNFYNKLGRDDCVSPKNWLPKKDVILAAVNRLRARGWVSEDNNSPLYLKPGSRALRSGAHRVSDASVQPKKAGKRNNLSISMVGFDQNKKRDDSPPRPPPRPLPFNSTNPEYPTIKKQLAKYDWTKKQSPVTERVAKEVQPDPPVPDFSADINPNENEDSSLFSASLDVKTVKRGEKRNTQPSPFSIEAILNMD